MEDDTKFLVDLAFLNSIGNYMAEKPYREVAAFMAVLAKMTPYKPPPAPEAAPEQAAKAPERNERDPGGV